ncbi:MAG TPA: ATP-binding protein, partial [bacterium]|nr:ATP-binding protein [bacterium]
MVKNNTDNYGAEQIQVLEGLEPVRKRPGMYIGSTGQEGLHHLVTEIVNNSMDEAIGGYADHIKVEFHKDGSVAIYDNGRGIPFDIKKGYGVSALELAFTKLHAGGKFGGGGYKVSSGLHGVGSSVVNALSKWCRVIVKRGNKIVIQEYENGGKPIRKVEDFDFKNPTKIKKSPWDLDVEGWKYENGTIVEFLPDDSIFETKDFDTKFFLNQLREYAYLTAGITFELVDDKTERRFKFYFEGGIKAYLKSLNRNKGVLNNNIFYCKKTNDNVDVEVAMQYNDSFTENVLCFANHLKNIEGGTHLTGFRAALTKCVNDYARANSYLKEKDTNLSGEDLREGLTAVISVALDSSSLQFEGQTKAKLGNTNVRQAVETVVKEALESFLQENPRDAQSIIEK